jgi:hypothetical protein
MPYIYKLSSPDHKLHYYGITYKTPQERFKNHIETYKNNYKACYSYIIFDQYGTDNIILTTIEQFDQISNEQLLQREKYYIQNFDCVNKNGKLKPSNCYSDINKNFITDITHTINIYNHDHIIRSIYLTLGYLMDIHTLDNPITIIHKDDALLSSVKDDLQDIINTFYKRERTHKISSNNIIIEINTILGLYNLQLITKKVIKFFRPGKYYCTFSLLIHPHKQPKHESLLAYLGISDDEN